MDELDRRILAQLRSNARMTVKTIAERVALTAPAVSERMRRMEKNGVIAGYTVRLAPGQDERKVNAIISIYVPPAGRVELAGIIEGEDAIDECYQVTGALSHMVKVSCRDITELDHLIDKLQKLGQTNTQIILSTLRSPSFTLE